MINYFLCILWPILIGGTYLTYKLFKDVWRPIGSVVFPLFFLVIFFFVLWSFGGGSSGFYILFSPWFTN